MVPPVPFPPKPLTAAGPSLPPKPSGPSPAARTSGSAATTSVLRCSGPAIRALSRQPCRPRQAHRASLSLQLMDSVGAPCSHKCGDVYEAAQQCWTLHIVYLSSCTSKGGRLTPRARSHLPPTPGLRSHLSRLPPCSSHFLGPRLHIPGLGNGNPHTLVTVLCRRGGPPAPPRLRSPIFRHPCLVGARRCPLLGACAARRPPCCLKDQWSPLLCLTGRG